jgi:hypothetical protein
MGPEARGVAPVPHIPDAHEAVREGFLQGGFEEAVLHHAGGQVVANKHQGIPLADGDQRLVSVTGCGQDKQAGEVPEDSGPGGNVHQGAVGFP